MTHRPPAAISFVVPVHNGAGTIRQTLEGIARQIDGRHVEIIVVDDRSQDDSRAIVEALVAELPIRLVDGPGRGAAAAINTGVLSATAPVICQVDQDVVIGPQWLDSLRAMLESPDVAAAQGYYTAPPDGSAVVRAMGLDLEQRYAAIGGEFSDHVCTGNTAYKAAALHQVGLFDERLGYGYDNDMSYRLRAAGYRLGICRTARSVHHWREGLGGYLRQQYGFGYGRLDVVAKHPRRIGGDSVSAAGMMAHPLIMLIAIICGLGGMAAAATGGPWASLTVATLSLVSLLAVERLFAGFRAWRVSSDRAAWLFAPLHLLRDLAWVAAIVTWTGRRLRRADASPTHSMHARVVTARRLADGLAARPLADRGLRALILIPAFNEASNLPAVLAELDARHPEIDRLVIDDGSTDDTARVLRALGARFLQFPQRLGIGNALRAGLRYAARLEYDVAIRIDGDGQHCAEDLSRLLGVVATGSADVAVGTRFSGAGSGVSPHALQRALARCLSIMTRTPVSDPTSGFYAIGPRALAVLAEHHPTGYPEPELRLFLSRNHLVVSEVAVRSRARMGGTTSLTWGRLTTAGARVLLAMIVVPFRGRIVRRA